MKIEVTILMPCLNEEDTLKACIDEAKQAIRAANIEGEVVVADNGSTDKSVQIAEENGARVVPVKRKGYGRALMKGIHFSRGKYILMGDADGSYDFGLLPRFLTELRKGNDFVMGCRLRRCGGTIAPGAMPWLHKWIGNPILSWVGRLFFRIPIEDFHCGQRAFRREAIQTLGLQCTGMEFASEMIVIAANKGLRITQIPVTLRPDGRNRPPHLRSWRDGWRHLRFMLLYSPKWLYLIPGSVLLGLGTIGFSMLLAGPVRIGQVVFDVNTLLVCSAAIIVGAQLVFFSIYAKAFAVKAGLLPPDPRIDKLLSNRLVDWGVAIGLAILIIGITYIITATLYWHSEDFGQLSASESLRMVIPGVTAISLGVLFMFSGFILELLNLERTNVPGDPG